MGNDIENPAKAGIGYTVGNYLLKGIGFITVPIFTRILSQEDFGIYNTFLAYESILYIIVGMALHSSLKNAYIKYQDAFDTYVSSICILPLFNAIFFVIVSFFCKEQVASLINLDSNVIVWLIIHSYGSGVMIFYSSKIALSYDYKKYIKVSLVNAVGNIMLSIILIFTCYENQKYMGRIVGSTISYILISFFILLNIFKTSRPRINKNYISYGLKISLPIIPHGLSQIVLLQFDRIMINSYIGSKQAAIYSFAYNIYSIIQITTNSLGTVFEPWFFKRMNANPEGKHRIQQIGTVLLGIITVMLSLLMLLSPETILVLGGSRYNETFYCLLPVLMAGFFAMAYSIPAVVEYYYEKTKYIATGTFIAATLNVILNMIFIPKFGYIAAAYTTLSSYIIYFSLHLVISRILFEDYIIKIKSIILFIFVLLISWVVVDFAKDLFLVRIGVALIIFGLTYFYFVKILSKEGLKRLIKQVIHVRK